MRLCPTKIYSGPNNWQVMTQKNQILHLKKADQIADGIVEAGFSWVLIESIPYRRGVITSLYAKSLSYIWFKIPTLQEVANCRTYSLHLLLENLMLGHENLWLLEDSLYPSDSSVLLSAGFKIKVKPLERMLHVNYLNEQTINHHHIKRDDVRM